MLSLTQYNIHTNSTLWVLFCAFTCCCCLAFKQVALPVFFVWSMGDIHLKKGWSYLTRRCALRESFPPTEVTLHVYVPMSPDQVWEIWRVPSASIRMRGIDCTLITMPSLSQTCLEQNVISQLRCWHCPVHQCQLHYRHCYYFKK